MLSVVGELLLLEGLLLELFSVVLPVGLVPLVASFFDPIEPTASGDRALWSRWRFADRARAIPFCLSFRTWSTLRSFVDEEALLSAVAAESPMLEEESELFAEIDESELFTVAELSELCGVAESLDELAVDFESSLVRCASLVAWSFAELPRFDCANAGAAPSASAARIAVFIHASCP